MPSLRDWQVCRRSHRQSACRPEPDFGVVTVVPTGNGALIDGVVAHPGLSAAFGLDISNLLP
jgi:hypothetical protein